MLIANSYQLKAKKMKITIDGHTVEVEPGTTVLEACRMVGGDSVPPTMCYYSKLKDCGANAVAVWWK